MLDDQTFILDAFGAIRVGNLVVCLGISSRLISEQNLHINRIQWLDPNSAITPDGETGRAQKHNKTTATTTKNIGGGGIQLLDRRRWERKKYLKQNKAQSTRAESTNKGVN